MRLTRLLHAMREISPVAEFALHGQTDSDNWICVIRVSQVVILESGPGELNFVLDAAIQKLKTMSQKMQAAIDREPKSG